MTLNMHSLQGRLLAVVIGVVTSVWLAAALLTWRDVRHELDELLDGHLAQAAAILVVQQASDIDDDGPEVDAPSLHRYAPKVAFQVFHEGRLSMRSANAPATPLLGTGKKFSTGFETVEIDNTTWRVFAAHGAERDVQVFVAEETRSRNSILWAVLRGTLLPMAIALPALALALWWAIHRSMAPLRRLGRTLAVRKPDTLEALAQSGVPTEMRPMVDSLNGLFERIATLLESERRFTADASHELRTPIAAIRAQAQVALGESDDALRRHALQNTLLGCDRAIHLVEQLLTLSRLEAAAAPTLAQVDMQGLARQVVADLAAKAIGKGQTLEFESDDQPCQASGNATLLTVLLRNLVDNAVRYSPPEARIRVAVTRVDGTVRLCVEDSGPGLPEPQRTRLGERFFRVPGTAEDGSGLGWSIVRRIAAAHHMQLRVEQSADLGGLSVQLIV